MGLFSSKKKKKPVNFINVIENRYRSVLTPQEISLLRKYFVTAAGGDRIISFPEFVELFGFLNPQCIGPNIVTIAERAFMASDTNFDGYITYDEFVAAYVLSKTRPAVPPFTPPMAPPMRPIPPFAPPFVPPMIPNFPPPQFIPPMIQPAPPPIPPQFLPMQMPPPIPPQFLPMQMPPPQFIPPYNPIMPFPQYQAPLTPPIPMFQNRPPLAINNYFRDNLISLLRIQSNLHTKPGYLNSQEAYYYLNWLHTFYGSPTAFPEPDVVAKKFTSRKAISYEDFANFIEPYYRNRSAF